MKFITVKTTDGENTLINLDNVNYIQQTGDMGKYIAIDMNTSMLEIEYSKKTWEEIVKQIVYYEKKIERVDIPKRVDVRVVNK